MSAKNVRWIALAAGVLAITIGYLAFNRTVTILADGKAHNISTRAITVGGAVKAAGIDSGPEDVLEPPSYAFLRDGSIIALNRAAEIQLFADGEYFSAVTAEKDPIILLAQFGLEFGEEDSLLLTGMPLAINEDLPTIPLLSLELRRAVTINVQDGEQSSQFLSSALIVGTALEDGGIFLFASDRLNPPADTLIDGPMTVNIDRSLPIEFVMGEESVVLRSAAESVGEALAEAGIALQGLDYSEPSENQPIPEERVIRVVRVSETVELQTKTIPYSVEWQSDPETEIDGRSVIQLGQSGVNASSVRIRFEDGEEISRVEESEWVLAEPVTQISGFGTQIVVRTAVVDGVEIEYWRALELFATSYSPCRSGVEKCYYYTPLGDEVKKGIAAVYLSWWYAMGQHTVYVPGYGPAKISDNGAYPDGRPWIDLGYSDDDWVTWGDWVTVYFTTPIPPENEILYILP